MKFIRILLPLDIKNHTIELCHITIQIFNKFIEILFDQLLVELQIEETTYLLTLQCTLQKPTLFFKLKPNDIYLQMYLTYTSDHCGKQI
jgi:hypothetical protein